MVNKYQTVSNVRAKLPSYDFQVVQALYSHLKDKLTCDRPTIVVLLKDFERVHYDVFSCFVAMVRYFSWFRLFHDNW
jgi:hypothetical protein